MKYHFNDENIVVGYIKELLHNFNLPVSAVYTEDTIPYVGRSYIKDNKYCKYIDGHYKVTNPYVYNEQILNMTKNLNIVSNTYDTKTHEYLGEYLRFIRDYHGINLMPLYNCFSNKILDDTTEIFKLSQGDHLIDTETRDYIYYLIPAKFNKEYTVAVDCQSQYEMFCVLYKNGIINQANDRSEDSYEVLMSETIKKINGSNFYNPFIYSTKFDASDIWSKENCLHIVLKLPVKISSSIVVLEGNYVDKSSRIGGLICPEVNSFGDSHVASTEMGATKLSLLSINNEISYPFADRLVEYLFNNSIMPTEKIEFNIKRIQLDLLNQGLSLKGLINDVWTDAIKQKIYQFICTTKSRSLDTINVKIGSATRSYNKKLIDEYEDILSFADKDVEYQLQINRS